MLSLSYMNKCAFYLLFLTSLQGSFSLTTMNIKPMKKQNLVFFPARFQQPLPNELYSKFITNLKQNYQVHIAKNNVQENNELLKNIQNECSEYESIGLLAHSSGVSELWDTYSSNSNVNFGNILLIEPLDISKGFSFTNPYSDIIEQYKTNFDAITNIDLDSINNQIEEMIETDYGALVKTNLLDSFQKLTGIGSQRETIDNSDSNIQHNKKDRELLLLKHKKSEKWRFVPTVPPLSLLASDLNVFKNSMEVQEIFIDKFSHFDILDRPWANMMNRASLGGIKTENELNNYLELLDNIICNFYDE